MQHVFLGLALLVQLQTPATPASPAEAPAATAEAPAATAEAPASTDEASAATPVTTTTVPAVTEAPTPAATKSLLPPKTKPRLLVIDVADKGAGPEITNAVDQAIQAQAQASHSGETVTTTQIRILLDAQATQQLVGCDSEACMTDIGKTIEADVIMGGNVTKVGDDIVITVITVDPKDGKRLKQEQRKTPINRDLYYYAAKQLASLVLTGKAADPRVPVVVSVVANSAPAEGQIIVDGKVAATGATSRVELDPGQHELVVKRSGFADWRTVLDVQEGAPLQVTANLVQERVYLWPVAVATGVAAVASGVAAALMFDHAQRLYDGNGIIFKNDVKSGPDAPYTTVSPTNSSELCTREREIAFFAGRAPSGSESIGTTNSCDVAAGPGVGASLGIASAVLGAATVVLLGTDLIIGAVSAE